MEFINDGVFIPVYLVVYILSGHIFSLVNYAFILSILKI